MKKIALIWSLLIFGCEDFVGFEDVVVIELPDERNLVVVEGSVTNRMENQKLRLTRSTSFSGEANPSITDAQVTIESGDGNVYSYNHVSNGDYQSETQFEGITGEEYRVNVTLSNENLIRSSWSQMPPTTEIVLLSVDDFIENDPENPAQNITVFFPRITARDSADFENYYRWIFFKNGERLTEPESITIQNDLFFDGNFIPNLFDEFEYRQGEEITVELQAINQDAFDFLSLVKSQITTLGSSTSTTPANVVGNLRNLTNQSETVLGYFGTTAISTESAIAEN